MKIKQTPKADFLDLLFENRNKAYGAYVLRRDYPRHLRRGLLGSFLLVGFFAMLMHWGLRESGRLHAPALPDVLPVELIDLVPPDLDQKPVLPPSGAASVRPTIQELVPIVVPDDVTVTNPLPTLEERLSADAGLRDAAGDPDAVAGPAVEQGGSGPAVPDPVEPAPPAIYAFEALKSLPSFRVATGHCVGSRTSSW